MRLTHGKALALQWAAEQMLSIPEFVKMFGAENHEEITSVRPSRPVRCGSVSHVGFHADAEGRKVNPPLAGRVAGRRSAQRPEID